ncbi:hypothetical protein AB4K20DRAFT_1969365 [Rhizopus microsporus]|uniref:Uncharacterized protein n=1 Tax=Rhizopus microsporus TaxID=58291 RepID=A0A1X0SF56_RHIZD|nr:hypothetical protein BCV71DRAFT_240752 [Rhizopus microsporus]
MTHSEVTFNYKMLHPCLEATVDLLYHASYPEPYYAPGEESIEAMIQQLVLINSKIERRKTAGRFQNKDTRKICSDNSRGIVGNRFSRVSPETFQKLNLYFVQASDEHIRLWSAQYASNGIYKFALDDKDEENNKINSQEVILSDII